MTEAAAPPPRRLGLWIPWAIFAALVLGWVAYWSILAYAAKDRVQHFVAQQHSQGSSIGKINIRGFPLQLALDISDVNFYETRGAFRVMTPRLVIHINPIDPRHVIIAFPAPVELTRSDAPHRASGGAMRVSVRLEGSNFAHIGFEADDFTLFDTESNKPDFVAKKLVINARADPRDAKAMQVALLAEDVDFTNPVQGAENLGTLITTLNAAIVLEKADAFAKPSSDILNSWRAAGGAMRIEALDLHWGPAKATGEGRITMDDTRRLSGAVTLHLTDPRATLVAIAAGPNIGPMARTNLLAAAALYEAPPEPVAFPLRAERGNLYLGFAKLRRLGPLYRDRD